MKKNKTDKLLQNIEFKETFSRFIAPFLFILRLFLQFIIEFHAKIYLNVLAILE